MKYLISLLYIIVIMCSGSLWAHTDSTQQVLDNNEKLYPELTISLITCGPGDELYASFGHTGLRIINHDLNTDEVYNYGMFNYSDPNFYTKFTLGKLDYYVAKYAFKDFIAEYIDDDRFVKEQILELAPSQKNAIYKYVEHNILPANRTYKYDFVFDNCATRVRDIFSESLGMNFIFNDVIGNQSISYRTIINTYLSQRHWERFGINLLLGNQIDSNMTNDGSMFLPDFLHGAISFAKFEGTSVVAKENLLATGKPLEENPVNGPLLITFSLMIAVIVVKFTKPLKGLQAVFFRLILLISGILGVIILFMWLGTNHQSCANNFNILWAFPANIIIAFISYKSKVWSKLYALIGMSLIIVTVLVHIIGLQNLPFLEILPLLVALMLIYIDMYQLVPASQKKVVA